MNTSLWIFYRKVPTLHDCRTKEIATIKYFLSFWQKTLKSKNLLPNIGDIYYAYLQYINKFLKLPVISDSLKEKGTVPMYLLLGSNGFTMEDAVCFQGLLRGNVIQESHLLLLTETWRFLERKTLT